METYLRAQAQTCSLVLFYFNMHVCFNKAFSPECLHLWVLQMLLSLLPLTLRAWRSEPEKRMHLTLPEENLLFPTLLSDTFAEPRFLVLYDWKLKEALLFSLLGTNRSWPLALYTVLTGRREIYRCGWTHSMPPALLSRLFSFSGGWYFSSSLHYLDLRAKSLILDKLSLK